MGLNFPYTIARYNFAWSSRGERRGPHVRLERDDIVVLYSFNSSIYIYIYIVVIDYPSAPCLTSLSLATFNKRPKS